MTNRHSTFGVKTVFARNGGAYFHLRKDRSQTSTQNNCRNYLNVYDQSYELASLSVTVSG